MAQLLRLSFGIKERAGWRFSCVTFYFDIGRIGAFLSCLEFRQANLVASERPERSRGRPTLNARQSLLTGLSPAIDAANTNYRLVSKLWSIKEVADRYKSRRPLTTLQGLAPSLYSRSPPAGSPGARRVHSDAQ
jgi:hypothetical protein